MFLKQALLRGSQLEDEVAEIYSGLASSPAVPSEAAASWAESARKERQRARILHALAELSVALDDDGPFLVQVPVQLANLRRVVDNVRGHVTDAVDETTARRCVETLESAPRGEVYAVLLEVAEPEIKRVLRLVDSEARCARGAGTSSSRARGDRDPSRQRGEKKTAGTCTPSEP